MIGVDLVRETSGGLGNIHAARKLLNGAGRDDKN
jgi:hypothetical protein